MTEQPNDREGDVPYRLLDPNERVDVQAAADEGVVLVTDRRLAVMLNPDRFDLDISFDALRRIQFDIERQRPASLVIVPEHPSDPPVVLAIPPGQYEAVAQALAVAGRRLHEISTSTRGRTSNEDHEAG